VATVADLTNIINRETHDVPADPELVNQWMQYRYASVLERAPWPFLIKEATFNTVGEVTAGTVTLTLNSGTVTETTSNANGWSSALTGRYFRRDGDNEFYEISGFDNLNPDTLTLERVYEGSSGTVLGYSIFQRLYAVEATDVREIIWMSRIDVPEPLDKVGQSEIDYIFPNRTTLGNPEVWAPAGRDSSNLLRFELYPIPDEAHGILYHYIQSAPSLADGSSTILPQVNVGLLRSGILADYWSWRCARADTPPFAIIKSQAFEAEFEKRLQEMFVRECPNFPAQKMRLARRYTRHRTISKFMPRVTLDVDS